LVFPENIGPYLSIDEKKGSIVGIFSGTKVEPIINQLLKIPGSKRAKVKEIFLDMAN